jgi:uncharacterized protein (TIGR02246 family)
MKSLRRIGLAAGAVILVGCAQQAPAPTPPPDTRAADEAAIRAAVKEWSAAAEAKDAAKFASFYADDGVVMLGNAAPVRGHAAIAQMAEDMMKDPNFALSFAAESVVAARSGDLAYETGTWSMTMSDAKKKPATEKGSYVVVWQKQADGAWKAVRDVPVVGAKEEAGKK